MSNALMRLPVSERSQAGEARRVCAEIARSMGFTEPKVNDVAIVASETAANLSNHAVQGEMLVSSNRDWLDILSVDRGPGMNVERCLEDGYSTGGTSGTGLGAIRRLSTTFDAWSEPAGTVLLSRIERQPKVKPAVVTGTARAAMAGETACGDNYAVRHFGPVTAMLLADGLGHGPFAADAANQAVSAFWELEWRGSGDAVDFLHGSLRGTRGAAIAVAALDRERRLITYCGLGNTSGVVVAGEKTQSMVSHSGTAGHNAKRIAEFQYAWPEDSLVIMHTDGLATSWSLAKYPGLQARHPAVISGVLYRDFTRGRDDVTVVTAVEAAQ